MLSGPSALAAGPLPAVAAFSLERPMAALLPPLCGCVNVSGAHAQWRYWLTETGMVTKARDDFLNRTKQWIDDRFSTLAPFVGAMGAPGSGKAETTCDTGGAKSQLDAHEILYS